MHTRTWTVEVFITEDEDERCTHADARLHSDGRIPLHGGGVARRSAADREVAEIGAELATARALADLACRLLDVTAGDVEQFTHRRAHLSG